MIFGNRLGGAKPGDTMFNSGVFSFFGDGSNTMHTGNGMFSKDGFTMQSGNMMFSPGGVTMQSGNLYSTPNGTYHRSGNMLFGPNGETWCGITSDQDCRTIIDREVNRKGWTKT